MTDPAESAPAGSNAPEISVTQLSASLKRTVEDAFGFVRVRGEISGYRGPHSSGHVYFALKDEGAKIDAVIWKGVFGRMRTRPQEGLEVIATGKITTYPGKSSYQIIIETLEPAGIGALMALLEERKKRLAAEGLFSDARKQLLPYLPGVIGVVTSPTGAVIRDILHRLADRFPRRVIVWPVRVQGETCAAEVAAAITGFNALPEGGPIPRPDVIIVARGGGSLEDLWGFNEEAVVRAAAASDIPLISAIGHETDWTLIDFAADVRAPTPTGAAEMVVPVRSDLLARLDDLARRHRGGFARMMDGRRTELRAAARALPSADSLLALPRQRLDAVAERLPRALMAGVQARRTRFAQIAGRLGLDVLRLRLARLHDRTENLAQRLPRALKPLLERRRLKFDALAARHGAAASAMLRAERERINRASERLSALDARRQRAMLTQLERRADRLSKVWSLVNALGHKGVLARGYALVTDMEAHPIHSVTAVNAGMALRVMLADGEFAAIAAGDDLPARKRKTTRPEGGNQGSLF